GSSPAAATFTARFPARRHTDSAGSWSARRAIDSIVSRGCSTRLWWTLNDRSEKLLLNDPGAISRRLDMLTPPIRSVASERTLPGGLEPQTIFPPFHVDPPPSGKRAPGQERSQRVWPPCHRVKRHPGWGRTIDVRILSGSSSSVGTA